METRSASGGTASSTTRLSSVMPSHAASTADRKWLMVTSQDFHTIYGQFIVTGSSGAAK